MAAAPPPKGWKVEYAKSGRAACKTCDNLIGKDSLRIAKVVPSTRFDGLMTIWHHSRCILSKPGRIKSLDDVEGVDDIRWEDNKKLKKYVENEAAEHQELQVDEFGSVQAGDDEEKGTGDFAVESAKSGRATCRSCDEKILKGELGWLETPVEGLPGWDDLSDEDQNEIKALTKSSGAKSKSGGTGSKRKVEAQEEPVSKGKSKGKKRSSEEENAPTEKKTKVSSQKGKEKASVSPSGGKPDDLEKKLEKQNKELWALKDELKKNASTSEYRVMLAENSMDVSGTEQSLRDRCADGMMFGALSNCPMCKGPIEYGDGQYKCKGYQSAWSKCTYTTLTPDRKAGKWKIPSDIDNEFLLQWHKKQKAKKEHRILLPSAAPGKANSKSDVKKESEKPSSKQKPAGPLGGLSIAIAGRLSMSQAKWKKLIEEAGGSLSGVSEDTYCIVTKESETEKQLDKLHQAQGLNISIVNEQYLLDCIEKQTQLPFTGYTIDVALMEPAMTKVKVKGRSAVHEDSDLQDTGHILEVQNVIYNVTLSLSDLSTGINSYYILQIIEDDRKNVHHLFRKWGRVGNNRIGGQKVEKLGKAKAINEFRRLFQEKTGNSWEDWENKEELEKHQGKFYPVDIDFGVNEEAPLQTQIAAGSKSKLDSRVISLMQLLFDVETYRAALMEFEINMSEMPLGKLSKRHIERGFQVLTEIQNLIDGGSDREERSLVDASNRFFTLIPCVHPNIIRDKKLLKAKIDMLEALRDIEIAAELIGSVGNSDEDPVDAHYGKLHCGISPVSRDSNNFKLVQTYLERTHAPTHKEWELELEDVFEVNREGEEDAYASSKALGNRMLLWHGSRTSNYVGILSQGLRIAPPEAPVSGYMFGKGLYFADLVSKSAQYCFTSKKSPTGLLLLCEVALGKTKDLKAAKYMDKPMSGANSTKGVGKTVPSKSEFEVWNDNVTVPCGNPVPSNLSGCNLQYNEYIVYDTSQVQLRFLLRVNFKHRR